ncbi:RNA polymerase sigma-70 factor [Puteibacter caeruleilacunae]|nr:RNA polymerase sigma-70 factor [Puteibacter caeruleilacunae]
MTDNLEIELLREGGTLSYSECFESMYPGLCSFATRFVLESEVAEDLVQDVFVRLWNRTDKFDSVSGVKVFLYQATRNICLNYLEHQKVKNKYVQEKIREIQSDSSYIREVIKEETHLQIRNAIQTLPPQTRKVLLMSLQDLKNKEIAEDLGISINTVKTHKSKAYDVLREALKDVYTLLVMLGC